ncbi:MAG: HPr kinase/phosphatase C-terminal domain-containing protein [Alphaproteobacteria bacterium]|nr:HPr kinase/phosphatase C-terminal domain-containing protein [Alphaproteobacteria bacterium]
MNEADAQDPTPNQTADIQGTCVAVDGAGVLLRGSSGSGKSDLALRLIDGGAFLVADDLTRLVREGEGLVALAPERLAGRIEARGLGIVAVPHIARAPLVLIVDLVAPEAIERLPEAITHNYLGLTVPLIRLNAFEASAPAKVRLAARHVGQDSGG